MLKAKQNKKNKTKLVTHHADFNKRIWYAAYSMRWLQMFNFVFVIFVLWLILCNYLYFCIWKTQKKKSCAAHCICILHHQLGNQFNACIKEEARKFEEFLLFILDPTQWHHPITRFMPLKNFQENSKTSIPLQNYPVLFKRNVFF